jgi:hypothetical protein
MTVVIGSSFALAHSVRDPALIRSSMELIADVVRMLRKIIATGDQDKFHRLQQIIRALEEADDNPGSRALH